MKISPKNPFGIGKHLDWDNAFAFYDSDKNYFMAFVVPSKGHWVCDIDSDDFKTILSYMLLHKTGSLPKDSTLDEFILEYKGKAIFEGKCYETYTRIAPHKDNGIAIDLGTDECTSALITPNKVEVGPPEVLFTRPPGLHHLPSPDLDGDFTEIFKFVRIQSDDYKMLLTVWMLASLMTTGPYPVLVFQGLQGAAKSTAARIIRALIDPSSVPLSTMSKTDREMMIAAKNSWLLVFDNLRTLKPEISDLLCRIATGIGFRTRKLYSDTTETIINACRPVIATAIHSLVTEPDLLDRSLIITLEAILKQDRRDETSFWAEFDAAKPGIFGGLLTCLGKVLAVLPDVSLDESPRMADFAKIGVATEKALGWDEGSFLRAYYANSGAAMATVLDEDPLAQAIILSVNINGQWEGTAAKLIKALSKYNSGLPKLPRAISASLRSMAPSLKQAGIICEFDLNIGKEKRVIRISPIPNQPEQDTSSVAPVVNPETSDFSDLRAA